jgi:hypothetical protein
LEQLDKIKEKEENVKETEKEKENIVLQTSYNRLQTLNSEREIDNKKSKEMAFERHNLKR